MSDNTIDTADEEVAIDSAEDQDVPGVEGGTEDQADATDDGGDHPSREAAKYRRRLRAVEAERDQLTQRLEAMQRAVVERQAEAAQLKPAALWASTELADLVDENGVVDETKVDNAIAAARTALGLPAPRRNHVPREGGNPAASSTSDSMIDAVMGRHG